MTGLLQRAADQSKHKAAHRRPLLDYRETPSALPTSDQHINSEISTMLNLISPDRVIRVGVILLKGVC